jgi:DNA-binding SARP family transcriptional activator
MAAQGEYNESTVRSIYVQLLGRARAQVGRAWLEFAPDKRYRLLAYLAYGGDWVSRDRLAYLFWPDTSTRAARQSLRQLLKRVRQLDWLAEVGLEAEAQRLRWQVRTDSDARPEERSDHHDFE